MEIDKKMVGVCFGSLALLAGVVGVFGLSWYTGKWNERKRKKLNQYQETQTSELTA
jgi:hypothetical protein